MGERVGVRGQVTIVRLEPLTRRTSCADLSHPNSGLPEFSIIEWSKSDISDFDWER